MRGSNFRSVVLPLADDGAVTAQWTTDGAIAIRVEPDDAQAPITEERLLVRVCERMVDSFVAARGDRTDVVVRAPSGAGLVRVTWSVETTRRDALRWLENAFFASIECAPAP